ncbi:hypothetical protein FJZ31_21205 [Candidatus Poribacteria bacterium]|nr:hypothetical protein [Candidatus Poribacteria bacterium]
MNMVIGKINCNECGKKYVVLKGFVPPTFYGQYDPDVLLRNIAKERQEYSEIKQRERSKAEKNGMGLIVYEDAPLSCPEGHELSFDDIEKNGS